MEKKTPHCKLAKIKSLIDAGRIRSTGSAAYSASLLGLSRREMINVVTSLTPHDFYKSMTTYADHRIWQDVYRPWTSFGQIYLKLIVVEDVLIVSFKEL